MSPPPVMRRRNVIHRPRSRSNQHSPARPLLGLLVFALMLSLCGAGPSAVFAQEFPVTEFEFDFEDGAQGWIAGFADLPVDYNQEIYELDSGHRQLPPGLTGSGMYLHGHNRSDDLFMFLKRQVAGLFPDTAYLVTFAIDLATNVPEGSVGIGGAPGESVYVKAGATATEPILIEDELGHLRMNIDKGNQSSEGEDMINLGNVAHPEVVADEYRIKRLDTQGRQFQATSDGEGRLWLIVGTDSGFEGPSSLFYDSISSTLSPVDSRPIALPRTGDLSLPDGVFVGMVVFGLVLVAVGTFALAKRHQ